MANSVSVLGSQFGDEGKGKVIDVCAEHADIIVRFSGGANSGHTMVVGDQTLATNLLPGGVMHKGKLLLMCDGMVIDPEKLGQEIKVARATGIKIDPTNLMISKKAHIVMPYHRELDALRESNSKNSIGTTKRGIGPADAAKAAKYGIRMENLFNPELLEKIVQKALDEVNPRIRNLGGDEFRVKDMMGFLLKTRRNFSDYIGNTAGILKQARAESKKILFEGSQGVMLDINQGTYPFVTSSNTTPAGVAIGSGISPKDIDLTIGVVKAYLTRVGEGPMPTELHDKIGKFIGKKGNEIGVTTGRPRRCGWLNAVELKYAIALGIEKIFLTKLDVLRCIGPIKVCTSYRLNGKTYADLGDLSTEEQFQVEAICENIGEFDEDISKARDYDDFPDSVKSILKKLEEILGIPILAVSVGPERSQVVLIEQPFSI